MLDSKEAIEKVLGELAERLDYALAPPIELAVCGGAALHVRGLMTRGVTRDWMRSRWSGGAGGDSPS